MPKKVFELANEIGIGALDLVEKLKTQGFNVRNHMTSLNDEEVDRILGLLRGKSDKEGTTKKAAGTKKVVKKAGVKLIKADKDESKSFGEHDGLSLDEENRPAVLAKSKDKDRDKDKDKDKEKESDKDSLIKKGTGITKRKSVLRRKAQDHSLQEDDGHDEDHAHSHDHDEHSATASADHFDDDHDHVHDHDEEMEEAHYGHGHQAESAAAYHGDDQEAHSLGHDERDEEMVESEAHDLSLEEGHLSDDQAAASAAKKGDADFPELRGLQIVYRPPAETATTPASHKLKEKETGISESSKVAEPAAKEGAAPAARGQKVKEYYEEKMHSFTPIYIPPVKKETLAEKEERERKVKEKEKEGKEKVKIKDPDVILSLDDDLDRKNDSKKRMGDLAAIMSKSAKVKPKDVSQLRADEELKSYSVGLIGKTIYTPPGKKKVYNGPSKSTRITEMKESKRVVQAHRGCTAQDLATKLHMKFEELRDKCLDLNLLIKPNDYFGIKLLEEIAALYNYRVEDTSFKEEEVLAASLAPAKEVAGLDSKLPLRSPVVTVMGHVDHGKTTLLDYIRRAKVASGEAGGITQHIGAYTVNVKDKMVTFLDTPGHAAFTSMRSRGANVTDIVVLVVAADDGVMPQTKECIRMCQAAGVPIIVAVNKMDKQGINPDRVKQELMEFHLTPEEWGGDTQYVPISALKGDGVDDLLESINIQAEMMELRADTKLPAQGTVLESKLEIGRGPLVTVLIQSGTLHQGDSIVIGETYGRARSILDPVGNALKKAGPSMPVQIIGLNNPPSPGDKLNVVKNEREAKKIVENRIDSRKELEASPVKKKVSLEDFFASKAEEGQEKKTLKLLIRADVAGSFEAIKAALENLGNQEVGVEIVSGGTGPITENDVHLANSVKAIILGFNMRPVTSAQRFIEEKGLEVKTYRIIYELIEDIKLALEGLLVPDKVEKYIGRAEVRDTFSIPKIGTIAGSAVIDGKIERGCHIRLLRDGKIVYDGRLSTLKRFKDDVKEVKNGYECGISLENFNNVQVNDIFEAYLIEEKKRTLDSSATL